MSAGVQGGGNSQDFELNLASIIDCFTVLIAFMLASAAFVSIGILDAGVAAAGAQSASDKPPAINITVELGLAGKMTLKTTGKSNLNQAIAAVDGGKPDYAALTRELASVHAQFTDVNALTLTADNATEYRDVVRAMEEIRKTIPVVLLGGF